MKLFIGNFSFSVTDDQLRDYFSKFGNIVSCKVMTEGFGGRSRGFGFVEFENAEDAQKAIQETDGALWEGRALKVSEDRSGRGGRDRGERGDYNSEERQAPIGYFRAQPLDLGIRKKKKLDIFEENEELKIDYKDPKLLSKFMSERGKILPRRMTGLSSYNQRQITRAIKRAQQIALLPVVRN
jgi:small subunit ribosomal protein S18